jgi:hypothetical protein
MPKLNAAAKKRAQKGTRRKQLYIAGAALIFVALVAQICLDLHFWRATNYSSAEPITSMIIEAVTATQKPAVIEPTTKQVYLPDANLVLPAQPKNVPNLLYSSLPSVGKTDAEVQVTTTNAMSVGISKLRNAESQGLMNHNSSKLFDAVPELQVCARGVHVVFGAKTKYAWIQFAKNLNDGRTMYVYTEQKSCAYSMQPLIDYLRGAQSYESK